MSWVTPPSPSSGGSSATAAAQYLVLAADATLTGERDFTPNSGLTATDGGAGGDYSLAATSRVIDRAAANVTSSGTATITLYSLIIPPNTLGTDKTLRMVLAGSFRNGTAAAVTLSIAVLLGATTIYQCQSAPPADTAGSAPFFFDFFLTAENSTAAQFFSGKSWFGSTLGATTGIGNITNLGQQGAGPIAGDGAGDSTTTLTFAVLVHPITTPGSWDITKRYAITRLI